MICKLCLQEKQLIRKSHIIPDFMYQGLFNEKHFIAPVFLKDLNVGKLQPTGFYDPDILCAACESQIIGKLESYAKLIIFGGKGNPDMYHRSLGCQRKKLNLSFIGKTIKKHCLAMRK